MSKVELGIDTGGTYTDAVLLSIEDGTILGSAKSLTTYRDLSVGIRESLMKLDRDLLGEVSTVSLSSTLATNSIVEGRGCRVGLVCIGRDVEVPLTVDHSMTVTGRFMPNGTVWEPLDDASARRFLESIRGKVDSIAVAGYMSIRNPEHENRVASMAREILGVPTVCGHELSSTLGFDSRAVTCVLNARLIPIIEELLGSVGRVMSELGIDAPLMIVKGDGSVMDQDMARLCPVETILSGPASSINGAMRMAGESDAIVVDIGGTTTDIGILRDGRIGLDPEGAKVGTYSTHVMAAEITTAGIGGDSRITVNGTDPVMMPNRVIPLCVASCQYPALRGKLEGVLRSSNPGSRFFAHERNLVHPVEFFVKVKDVGDRLELTDLDRAFMDYIDGDPHSLKEASVRFDTIPSSFDVTRMEGLGFIQRIGFTPTDLMHVKGVFDAYDREASMLGARYYAIKMGVDMDGFVSIVDDLIADRISWEIMRTVIRQQFRDVPLEGLGLGMARLAMSGGDALDYSMPFRLNKPIIGLGGPVYDMLPRVAERLGTELILPPNYEIGNAIGAVTGKVVVSIDMLIRPAFDEVMDEDDGCILFSRLGRTLHPNLDEARRTAEEMGRDYVTETARKAGAGTVEVTVDESISRKGLASDGTFMIEEATIRVTATGEPRKRL